MKELYDSYFNVLNEIIWRVAIYVRLSREDEKDEKGNGQSESIENQINFLRKVVENKGWILVDIYKDDGYTGTNFDRPDFQRMKEDIEKGKINLVITKDLSRLGRDYIETGNYIERYFPSKNVRYIAVNDNIDTFDKKNSNNDMTPFKSVINDMYAKDISNKVRTAIFTKAIDGECIKSFLPYGYKKDVNDKNNILIDENVADIVKLIFNLYKQGKGKKQIADYLNERNIITPLKYKNENTNYYNPNKNFTYKWNQTVISKILRDRIYAGDLVQLKYTKVNYKVKKTVKVSEKEQIIIKNHHPAIIDRNTFETVQEMLEKKANEWNFYNRKRHLLTGLVFCKCGSRITYNLNHGKFSRCVCASYKKYGNAYCSSIHLHEEELIQKVTESLRNNIEKYLHMSDLDFSNLNKSESEASKKDILFLEKKEESISKIISNLYEDKVNGIISLDTFSELMKKYEKQKKECMDNLEVLHKKKENIRVEKNIETDSIKEIMKQVLSFNEITDDNRSLIFKLIDKIIIDDRNISIKYKFNISG